MAQRVNKAVVEVQTMSLLKWRAAALRNCLQSLEPAVEVKYERMEDELFTIFGGLYALGKKTSSLKSLGDNWSLWPLFGCMQADFASNTFHIFNAIMGEERQLVIHVSSARADGRLSVNTSVI